ncbi:CU044_5270 family protein [Streptomyces sp. 24-1644]|uniref:CU044_5270 family protein n=1 Tax=unclassified Streptomyces TaxID=2593676 RepID=UPI0036641781
MNRTPWRRHREPLDHAELAGLLPAPGDPVLPHGRMTTLEEHLMNEIQQAQAARKAAETEPQPAGRIPSRSPDRPSRGGRRLALIGAAVAVAVLAGAAGAAQFTAAQDGIEAAEELVPAPVVRAGQGTTQGLNSTVALISGAAAREKLPEPKPGQFIYVRSQVSWLSESQDADGKIETFVQKPHPRQVWMSPDGRRGWLIEPGNGTTSREGLTLDVEGEASNEGPTLGAPSYDYLKKLSTDPDELLEKIYRETKGQGNGPDQQAFTTIGDLVREQVMPAELTSALYRAAAKIPGVMVVEKSTDAVGRQGIAIARTDEHSGDRTEWIFDAKTFSYLGERTVQMRDRSGIKAGTVTGHTAVTERAVVDGMKELPGSRSGI